MALKHNEGPGYKYFSATIMLLDNLQVFLETYIFNLSKKIRL